MSHLPWLRGVGWTVWGLLPVGFLAFHFGPGERIRSEDEAGRLLAAAHQSDVDAQAAQDDAYACHLELLGLRLRLHEADRDHTLSLGDKTLLQEATQREKAAYARASELWSALSERLAAVDTLLSAHGSDLALPVRITKARAMIRAGLVNTGIDELNGVVDTLRSQPAPDGALLRQAREELAAGYYYNARLMRVAGRSTAEWKEQSTQARQEYRYLAETARDDASLADQVAPFQMNVERVLNLEQSALEDLIARPMPRNSPESRRMGDKEGLKKKGSRRGKRGPNDGRGAGSMEDIGPGW